MKVSRNLITLVLAVLTGLTTSAVAATNSATTDNLMAKCMLLSMVNDLDFNREQLEAMVSVAEKLGNKHAEMKEKHQAELAGIYTRLVAGEKISPEEFRGDLKAEKVDGKKPKDAEREQLKKDVEKIWAMLTPDQQEGIREMPMPGKNKGRHMGRSMGGPMPPADDMPFGPPPGHDMVMDSPDSSQSVIEDNTEVTKETDGDAETVVVVRKIKKSGNPGFHNLMQMLSMPGAIEALKDRLSTM